MYARYNKYFVEPMLGECAFELTLAFVVMYREMKHTWVKALLGAIWQYTGVYVMSRVIRAWKNNLQELGRPAADHPDEGLPREFMFPLCLFPDDALDGLDITVNVAEWLKNIASKMVASPSEKSDVPPVLRQGLAGGRCVTRPYSFPLRAASEMWESRLLQILGLPYPQIGNLNLHALFTDSQQAVSSGGQQAAGSDGRQAEGSGGQCSGQQAISAVDREGQDGQERAGPSQRGRERPRARRGRAREGGHQVTPPSSRRRRDMKDGSTTPVRGHTCRVVPPSTRCLRSAASQKSHVVFRVFKAK